MALILYESGKIFEIAANPGMKISRKLYNSFISSDIRQ